MDWTLSWGKRVVTTSPTIWERFDRLTARAEAQRPKTRRARKANVQPKNRTAAVPQPLPIPPPLVECSPQSVQCIVDKASVSVSVNNAFVDLASSTTVTAGSPYAVVFNFTNMNVEALFAALLYVRDDGMEHLSGCLGLGISIGGGGGFNFSGTISASDPMFAPGHTVRLYVVATFGQIPPADGCPLRTATGGLNQAAVQGQRHLATFVRQ